MITVKMPEPKKKKRVSLSTWIFIGVAFGIVCGLFFGEYCQVLEGIGGVFIGLLQMSILPYIVVSLIVGIGSLTVDKAKLIAAKGGIWLSLLWGIGFAVIFTLPMALPTLKTASFFSRSLLAQPEKMNVLQLFIPSNPFRAMTDNIIPAVVLFSIAIGLALIGIKDKHTLIQPLTTLSQVLTKITKFVINLAPLGVFAITASAAGTLTLDELGRLQAYFILFIFAAIMLTFWILPAIISAFTPFKYSDIIKVSKEALVTGFATDSLFIILPILIHDSKELFKKYKLEEKNTTMVTDIVIPVAFNFPLLGRMLAILFVLFAAWFYGQPIAFSSYPVLMVTGLASLFGKAYVAVPFLLDLLHLPADIFELYHVTTIINGRFATLLSAVHLLALTFLITAGVCGVLRVNWKKVFSGILLTVLIMAVGITGINIFLSRSFQDSYGKDQVIVDMQLLSTPAPATIHKSVPVIPEGTETKTSTLNAIHKRGSIRVGYIPDMLPGSYFNSSGDLVGFDVEMAHILAKELGIHLDLIPVSLDNQARMLKEGRVDIVMSGTPINTSSLQELEFAEPHMDVTLALLVSDYHRQEFSRVQKIREMEDLKIGIRKRLDYFVLGFQEALPLAELVEIPSIEDFFEGRFPEVDAYLTSAESGSAWTLLYPDFQVVVPKPDIVVFPVGYALAPGNQSLGNFMNRWIGLQKKNGTIKRLYDHWILGLTAVEKKPRWSVLRDVLHWVD